jgi:hypothetical protein
VPSRPCFQGARFSRRLLAIILLATAGAVGSDNPKSYPIAVWLIPAQEQQRQIQRVISDLAAQYSSAELYIPVFRPHATLCVGKLDGKHVDEELQNLFKSVDYFADNHDELSLAVRADQPIGQRREQWSQFLFLALDNNDAPGAKLIEDTKAFCAVSDLEPSTDARDKKRVMLHVSLMYNGIANSFSDIAQKVANKDEYDLPDQVVFEGIQVVTPRSGNFRDVLRERPDVNGDWKVLYTRKLKSPVPPLRMVMAGGQTGVDQAAWRSARLNRILIGGWCPPGRHQGRRQWTPSEFPCQESRDDTSAAHSDLPRSQRTEWNVRDADATLILRKLENHICKEIQKKPDIPRDVQRDIDEGKDRGTGLTIEHALGLQKQAMICDPSNFQNVKQVVRWIELARARTLNVGGPSEATDYGIGGKAEQFLLKVFAQLRNANASARSK